MYTIRVKLGVTIGFILLIMFTMIKYVPALSQDPLNSAMQATGAHLQEYSINAWVKVPSSHLSDQELQNIVEQVMKELEMNEENYEIVHQQRNKQRIVRAEFIRPDYHAVAVAQVVPAKENGLEEEEEAYLVVNLESIIGEPISIIALQEKMNGIAKKIGDSPRISTCLIGWLDGKLMDGESQNLLKSAFSAIDGVIVDELDQEQYVSVTGFSPVITDYLQVGGKKININMAVRYSQYDNRTYLIIGSPIITREY
ncbi:MAG: hypothetical protein H6Q68_3765 [Firmicutes bacterium]|nr:hypothetical protein [Bacillota bacterium]